MENDFHFIASGFSGTQNITTSVDVTWKIALLAGAILFSTLAYYFAIAPQKTINKFAVGILSIVFSLAILFAIAFLDLPALLTPWKEIRNFEILPIATIPLLIIFTKKHLNKNLKKPNTIKVILLSFIATVLLLALSNLHILKPPLTISAEELEAVKFYQSGS